MVHILVVEDDRALNQAVTRWLMDSGFENIAGAFS